MILRNLSWLTISQAVRLVTGLLVGTWLTRSLGPEQNGILGTTLVIGTLAGFAAELGLRQILIKEFAQNASAANIVFGTAARLMFGLGVMYMLLALAVAGWWGGTEMLWIGFILYAPLPLQAATAVFSRWDAAQQSRRTASLALGANIFASLARVICIWSGADLRWAAATIALESVISMGAAFAWSLRHGWTSQWFAWDRTVAVSLLKQALPHFLAHSGTLLLLRMDQIMVFQIRGATEAGIYAAATKLSEVVYASGPLMIMAFMPVLARAHHENEGRYQQQRRWLFGALTLLAYGSVALWLIMGSWVTNFLYGAEFAGVYPVLMIHAFAALPYLHGELRSSLLVIEGRAAWSARCAIAGLCLNIMLNLWLIPAHGAVGAAWATAISYTLVWFASSLLLPVLRQIGWQQCAALLSPFWLWRETRDWRRLMS